MDIFIVYIDIFIVYIEILIVYIEIFIVYIDIFKPIKKEQHVFVKYSFGRNYLIVQTYMLFITLMFFFRTTCW